MTTEEAAVSKMVEDDFPGLPEPGDQVTGSLCRIFQYLPKNWFKLVAK